MIPITLQIKNFLSYGPEIQTIQFEPYRLICLSGRNGHGKSALLDAITWAVWGQARKISGMAKADANLLRLGQTQMMVSLDFECNGHRYRIRREYAKTYGKPYAALDFGFITPEDKVFHPLTDKTIRATQHKIESTIGLNFETFINSAFLRQGQSHEFSQKSPKDRKKILASILDLDQYETLRKAAMEKNKEASIAKEQVTALLASIKTELDQSGDTQEKQKKCRKQLEAIKKNEQEYALKLTSIEKKQVEFTKKEQAYNLCLYQKEQLLKNETEKQSELRKLFELWRKVNRLKRSLSQKLLLEKEKDCLEKEIKEYQKKFQRHLDLQQNLLTLKEKTQAFESQHAQTVSEKAHHFKIERERCTHTIQELKKSSKKSEDDAKELSSEKKAYEKELIQLKATITALKKRIKTIASAEALFEKRKHYYHTWVAQANAAQNEYNQLLRKQNFTLDEKNPSCPLCEQNLSASRKRFLKTKFSQEQKKIIHRLHRFKRIIPRLKKILMQQHEELKILKKDQEEEKIASAKISDLEKQLHKYELNIQKIKELQKKYTTDISETEKRIDALKKEEAKYIKESNNSLKKNTEYIEIIKQQKNAQKELEKLSFNSEALKNNEKKLQEITDQLEKFTNINQQISSQHDRKQQIHAMCNQLRVIKKEKITLEKQQKILEKELAESHALKEEKQTIQSQISSLYKQKEEVFQEKGRLENQLLKRKQHIEQSKEYEKKVKKLDSEAYDYQLISQALSKDGIQALLIEDALPEIEQEANALLAQLTENQAHIIIDSLRDLKKGGSKETLDIKISDPMGIRPYELYSGGEAFRIDFALRIAISKLLARRAGTSLQTLIIDEGFGSQDEEGLSRIMDAIYKIQDNFCKVIIVSHLATMKDQFPVHFYVEKGPNGSKVKVVEQG